MNALGSHIISGSRSRIPLEFSGLASWAHQFRMSRQCFKPFNRGAEHREPELQRKSVGSGLPDIHPLSQAAGVCLKKNNLVFHKASSRTVRLLSSEMELGQELQTELSDALNR